MNCRKSTMRFVFMSVSVFIITIVYAGNSYGAQLLNIIAPKRLQTFDKCPVEIRLKLFNDARPKTLIALLNRKDISAKFVQIGDMLVAKVGPKDGLIIDFQGDKDRMGVEGQNFLRTRILGNRFKEDSDFCLFFVNAGIDPLDVDNDGDGFSENQGDCDDADYTIHPNAIETCGDGIDQNCDGVDCSEYDGTYTGKDETFNFFELRIIVDGYQVSGEAYSTMNKSEVSDISGIIDEDGSIAFTFEYLGFVISFTGTTENETMVGTWEANNSSFTPNCEWRATKIEDFETGDLFQFPWKTTGDGKWIVTDVNPFEGYFSAQSPDLRDNESASLSITRSCEAGEITFTRAVSSEYNYDYLYFYIDGVIKGAWSGAVGYTQSGCMGYTCSGGVVYTQAGCLGYTQSGCLGYTVSNGVHEFKWEYRKDRSVSDGADAAWIDYIRFPQKR